MIAFLVLFLIHYLLDVFYMIGASENGEKRRKRKTGRMGGFTYKKLRWVRGET